MPDAEVHALPPLVRAEPPVPVAVHEKGEWLAGFVVAWRGDRVHVEYSRGIGMKHLGWFPAGHVRRVGEELPERP